MKKYYFYPLIVFVFLVSYHFYSFYEQNFFQMKKILLSKTQKSYYEKIQSEHPYYEIWKLAQQNKKVTFINEQNSDGALDYTTTYFRKKRGDKSNYYLSELKLVLNYFFYPRLITTYSFYTAVDLSSYFNRGEIIVSDFDLDTYAKIQNEKKLCPSKSKTKKEITFDEKFEIFYKRLKKLEISKKNYLVYNRHQEKPYYIYEVIK